jgi:hypothetical protein
VHPFIPYSSIPLVVNNLILVYPPQSDCEKNLSISVVERLVMDTKSAIEGSTSGNAHVEVVELWKRWCWNILLLIEGPCLVHLAVHVCNQCE